jgi:hypothetical protein
MGSDGLPRSIAAISAAADGGTAIQWEVRPPSDTYLHHFVFTYGLYARHGRFYPPYNFIPDVNYGELLQNVW